MRTTVLYLALFIVVFVPAHHGCSRHGDFDDRNNCPQGTAISGGECLEDGGTAPIPEGTSVPDTAPVPDAESTPDETETPGPEIPEAPSLDLVISSPLEQFSTEAGTTITFEGTVAGIDASDQLATADIVWSSRTDGVLHAVEFSADGTTSFSSDTLTPGIHIITLEARSSGESLASTTIQIGICGWEFIEDFNEELSTDQWKIYHDAYQDNRGWIEMTGNTTGRKGHIFNIGQTLNAGNIRLGFSIATGQCDEIGNCSDSSCAADGFAASVYNAEDMVALDAVIASTETGGGLGYHISGGTPTESFHIEFDTWYNGGQDPTAEDHIAIHLNSDAHNAVFYEIVPNLEDNSWHEIILDIQGVSISVNLDGTEIISGDIPGFNFKGGYIGFSGTTGACTNYHRIDDLRRQPQCTF